MFLPTLKPGTSMGPHLQTSKTLPLFRKDSSILISLMTSRETQLISQLPAAPTKHRTEPTLSVTDCSILSIPLPALPPQPRSVLLSVVGSYGFSCWVLVYFYDELPVETTPHSLFPQPYFQTIGVMLRAAE